MDLRAQGGRRCALTLTEHPGTPLSCVNRTLDLIGLEQVSRHRCAPAPATGAHTGLTPTAVFALAEPGEAVSADSTVGTDRRSTVRDRVPRFRRGSLRVHVRLTCAATSDPI